MRARRIGAVAATTRRERLQCFVWLPSRIHLGEKSRVLTSVKKAATIIEAFVGGQREWTILELSRKLGMPQPTVHHFLASFRELGWITQDSATKRYRLGIKLWEIGCASVNFRELAESARPHLRKLVEACGETAHLGMISNEDPTTVVYVDRVDSSQPVRIVTMLGSRAPSHSSAMGKAILAHNADFEARVLAGPLEAVTPHTLIEPKAFRRDLQQTRARGYSIGRGEFAGDMIGIAAPVYDRVGAVALGVGIWAPAARMTREVIERDAPKVVEAAHGISRTLGFLGA
ncbi:DNA-binding transcriptional regulator, IclR family [Chitinasiproducens palmae]|uniref:DNA-binding transcriptional regulator, IclR family n=2 Tax=Chitinasiproducens palmae TaxID=1770053 RepID=A0A1H2PPS4_9BURK|nr:DNA-binding transcriptional regulator, IclR family [Chitinasiproducens palmae]